MYECPRCSTAMALSSINLHLQQYCNLIVFRNVEAAKYGMVSIVQALTPKYDFDYVSRELGLTYPKIASMAMRARSENYILVIEIFVEQFGADAIRQFIKNDG